MRSRIEFDPHDGVWRIECRVGSWAFASWTAVHGSDGEGPLSGRVLGFKTIGEAFAHAFKIGLSVPIQVGPWVAGEAVAALDPVGEESEVQPQGIGERSLGFPSLAAEDPPTRR